MNREHYAANLWKWKCGLPEETAETEIMHYDDLESSEWSPQFERLMRSNLIIGAYRYGKLNAPGKPQYDRLEAIIKRANMYKETGNDDYLIDIANFCLLEYEEGDHPKKHIKHEHEHNYHVKRK